MGAYLARPVTDKESESGESEIMRYGVSSMQGWRVTMEDAVSTRFVDVFALMGHMKVDAARRMI